MSEYLDYADLPSETGVDMRCSDCGDGPYSACAGDYFWASGQVACSECGAPMELGREATVWNYVWVPA